MKFEYLCRYWEADVAQEVGGAVLEAGEEVEDEGPERGEVVGEAVEVQHVLLEPAPDLLDGVGPGGVGGEGDELDREVEALGPRAGRGRPGPWGPEPATGGLGFEGGQDIGMVVDRPVVQDEVDPSIRIGGDQGLVEADQGRDADAGALVGDDPAGVGIEGTDDPGGGSAPGRPLGPWLGEPAGA